MQFILISGPPGSGKDTVGKYLQDYSGRQNVMVEKFATPLIAAAEAMGFNMAESEKDRVHPVLGMSRRQFQIHYSEQMCKPLFGERVFGNALVGRVYQRASTESVVVVTDSGFREEAEAVVDAHGTSRVIRVHLTRPGHDYTFDSRSDWDSIDGMKRIDVTNDGSMEDLFHRISEELGINA